MIIFLYGEDTYNANQRLKVLKDKYVEKFGDTNLLVFEENFDLAKIKESIVALPFLAEKRMTILKNILKVKDKVVLESILATIEKIPEETILVFFEEGVPDKRLSLFKKLAKESSQEFAKISGFELVKWVRNKFTEKGSSISSRDADKLISFVGNDLNSLNNEIEKLTAYKNSAQVTDKDIDILVSSGSNKNIFDLIDSLGGRNYKKAIGLSNDLITKGENEIYILAMIAMQIRNLILVFDANSHDKMEVSKKTGIHPYVVQKALLQLKNFTIARLKEIYEEILEVDIAIKTGEIEAGLALEKLIREVCFDAKDSFDRNSRT